MTDKTENTVEKSETHKITQEGVTITSSRPLTNVAITAQPAKVTTTETTTTEKTEEDA